MLKVTGLSSFLLIPDHLGTGKLWLTFPGLPQGLPSLDSKAVEIKPEGD